MWRNKLASLVVGLALLVGLHTPSANAVAKFLVLCTTVCTWDNTNDAIWSTSTGGTNNTTHPVAGDTATLDANSCVGGLTCTITVAADLTMTTITMSACTASTSGCILDFSANNNNVNLSSFTNSGSGVRTLNMGNGTWTLSGTSATVFNQGITTNLTFNANSSNLKFSATTVSTRTFAGGGKTFSTVTVDANTSGGLLATTGANVIGTLAVVAPAGIGFAGGITTTISSAFSLIGSSGSEIFLTSSTLGTVGTVSVASGTPTMSWTGVRDLTFTGGATFTATSSFDLGNNTGITITAPSTGGGKIIGG